MIISTVITVVSFIVIIIDIISVINVLRTCRNVRCSVVSSQKVTEREDGFLIKEYFDTSVMFTLDNMTHNVTIQTSTFCQKGQILNCFYYPKRQLVFRKRDIRMILSSYTIPAFSVGVVFLLLIFVFEVTSLGGIIIQYAVEALAVLVTIPLTVIALYFIIYSVGAFRHTRHSRVTEVRAEIIDVIRKTNRHRENVRYSYLPIYRYTLNGVTHTVQSRLARDSAPKRNSREKLLVDTKKGGPVEYKDIYTSFTVGVLFLIIAAQLLFLIPPMK